MDKEKEILIKNIVSQLPGLLDQISIEACQQLQAQLQEIAANPEAYEKDLLDRDQ